MFSWAGRARALTRSNSRATSSPAASHFPQRLCTAAHEPDLHIPLTRSWLDECLASHKACSVTVAATAAASSMPTRVIEVGAPGSPTRLVATSPAAQEAYLALSYCWGPGADTFTLTRRTMQSMLLEIDEAALARTHREVLALARAHAIRYVWIDALCIVQGDAEDWERESKRMEQVYENATVTIVAGRADDARNGFVANDYRPAAEPCAVPLGSDPAQGELFVALPRSRAVGPVETRGWCFQEAVLSRRAIVYGAEQLMFRCRTGTIAEDFGKKSAATKTASAGSPEAAFIAAINAPPETRREQMLNEWYHVVSQYSKRRLSNPHDVFAAVSSLARLTQHGLQSRYLAGVWESDLVPGLMWIPFHHHWSKHPPLKRPSPTKFAPPPVTRAPSWSWAAVEGPVFYTYRGLPKFRRPGFITARPALGRPGRWSPKPDADCDAGVLHVPSLELHVTARVVRAGIAAVSMSAREYLVSAKEDTRRLGKVVTNGVLLRPADSVGPPDLIFGIGRFDLEEEACDEVWCLQLTYDDGLMLVRDDGSGFRRRGRFQLLTEHRGWFERQDEMETCLV